MGTALQIEDLSLSINGNRILDNVSFSLAKGSFAAMCGRNGAGKSQLLRCIKGLRKPDSGRILIDGAEADGKTRMKRIALVFQNAEMQVVSQSVEKDIAFGPENMGLDKAEIARRVDNALSLMDLKDKARQRPQTLSGGELRKCAIAGIIAMEPDVILLDEPMRLRSSLPIPICCLSWMADWSGRKELRGKSSPAFLITTSIFPGMHHSRSCHGSGADLPLSRRGQSSCPPQSFLQAHRHGFLHGDCLIR